MSTIQAIADLMEMINGESDRLESLTVLTKLIAEQEQTISDLNQTNNYLRSQLADANKRLSGGAA